MPKTGDPSNSIQSLILLSPPPHAPRSRPIPSSQWLCGQAKPRFAGYVLQHAIVPAQSVSPPNTTTRTGRADGTTLYVSSLPLEHPARNIAGAVPRRGVTLHPGAAVSQCVHPANRASAHFSFCADAPAGLRCAILFHQRGNYVVGDTTSLNIPSTSFARRHRYVIRSSFIATSSIATSTSQATSRAVAAIH